MYKIALIPGDGIGPEVTNEAMKVFGAAADKTGFKYETIEYDFGGRSLPRNWGDLAKQRA